MWLLKNPFKLQAAPEVYTDILKRRLSIYTFSAIGFLEDKMLTILS